MPARPTDGRKSWRPCPRYTPNMMRQVTAVEKASGQQVSNILPSPAFAYRLSKVANKSVVRSCL